MDGINPPSKNPPTCFKLGIFLANTQAAGTAAKVGAKAKLMCQIKPIKSPKIFFYFNFTREIYTTV